MTTNLPSVAETSSAKLPTSYLDAKKKLAHCARVDECKAWSDKAMALASYARQAQDEELLKYAKRIIVRAIDRQGEILKSIPEQPGKRTDRAELSRTAPTRSEVAREAGLSKDQQVTAIRVNNVDRASFEAQVESDDPPTVTELASQGTRTRQKKSEHRTAEETQLWDGKTATESLIEWIAEKYPKHNTKDLADKNFTWDEAVAIQHEIELAYPLSEEDGEDKDEDEPDADEWDAAWDAWKKASDAIADLLLAIHNKDPDKTKSLEREIKHYIGQLNTALPAPLTTDPAQSSTEEEPLSMEPTNEAPKALTMPERRIAVLARANAIGNPDNFTEANLRYVKAIEAAEKRLDEREAEAEAAT